jgi:GNAT superfamily N-acetyltransferase
MTIEPLDRKRHDRANFSCGVAALDAYIQRQAAQDMAKHAAVVYVAVVAAPAIAGYYTLSQFAIDFVHLPEELARRLPRYPVAPATLLGRLAVDRRLQGQGMGETLLFDALRRSLVHSAHIASAGVIVDAKDDISSAFYRRYGFVEIPESDRRAFLSMETIRQMFP